MVVVLFYNPSEFYFVKPTSPCRGGENRAGDCVADICPLPHARNHFVITTGFVATKVAERKVTEAKSDEEMQTRVS